jgi:hypothetical protein
MASAVGGRSDTGPDADEMVGEVDDGADGGNGDGDEDGDEEALALGSMFLEATGGSPAVDPARHATSRESAANAVEARGRGERGERGMTATILRRIAEKVLPHARPFDETAVRKGRTRTRRPAATATPSSAR